MTLLEIAQLLWDKQSTDCLQGQTLFVQHVEGQIFPQSEVVFNAEPGYVQVCEAEWFLTYLRDFDESRSLEEKTNEICGDINTIHEIITEVICEEKSVNASK
jgi:hypothetical protein